MDQKNIHDVDVFIGGLFNGEEEIVKQTTGIMEEVDGQLRIEYFERFEGDLEETRSTIVVEENTVHVQKIGSVSSILHFEKDMTHNTTYQTPEGDIPMTIETDSLEVVRQDTGCDIKVVYKILFDNMEPLTNILSLKVRYKDHFIIT